MDSKSNPTLLPQIIDLLSRKQKLCLSIESLCNEVKNVAKNEHTKDFDSLQEAVEFGIKVGIDLGILVKTKTNCFRVPFNFGLKKGTEMGNTTENCINPAEGHKLIDMKIDKVKKKAVS